MDSSFSDAILPCTPCYPMALSRRDNASVAAVIFDVDGTLYRQSILRRAMLFRLLRAQVLHPGEAVATFRILWSYRGAHEQLRNDQLRSDPLRAGGSGGAARAQPR